MALGRAQMLWEHREKPHHPLDNYRKTGSLYMPCVPVCTCVPAQVCRGSEAGRRADRRTGCLWGQGLGGVLAGTTPDSNSVDVPWQFCTFMSLLIKVSTCWAGETTVVVHTGQGEEDENTSFRLSFPVPPALTEQTSCDSCDRYWLGRGEDANLVSARGWEQSYMHHLIWTGKMKPGCFSCCCVTAKGKRKSTELSLLLEMLLDGCVCVTA